MINEFLKLRGNCVFFMDYSFYSSRGYFLLTPHFNSIANLLSEKILKISEPENVVLFGFSFGARLVTKAGAIIASFQASKVDRIYGKLEKKIFFGVINDCIVMLQHVTQLDQGLIQHTDLIREKLQILCNAFTQATLMEQKCTIVIRIGGWEFVDINKLELVHFHMVLMDYVRISFSRHFLKILLKIMHMTVGHVEFQQIYPKI